MSALIDEAGRMVRARAPRERMIARRNHAEWLLSDRDRPTGTRSRETLGTCFSASLTSCAVLFSTPWSTVH